MDQKYASRLLAEAVGTFGFFFIGFSGIAAATAGTIPGPAAAAGFGLGLGMMIFAFGQISGGHFNPAVTLGLTFGRQFDIKDVIPYWIAQLVGGLAAAGAAAGIYEDQLTGGNGTETLLTLPGAGVSDANVLLIEIIATAFFVIVISSVATDSRAPWSGVLAPVAIGGFFFTVVLTMGGLSGGSFNSALSLAPALITGEFGDIWLYIVGPLVGGAIGGAVFWVIRGMSGDTQR